MTVDNYDRFMEVAPGEVDTSRFFLRCKATDPNHYRTAAKLEIKDTILEFGLDNGIEDCYIENQELDELLKYYENNI